nr:GNAT family acetyltransferase [uncultured Butyrivibrio sp.]
MKRLLVMCEGSNEKKVMDILLEHGCLTFSEDNLLGLSIFHARQIKNNAQVKLELNMFPGEVEVLRIGDKQNEKLDIPKDYKTKITKVDKYCTKPELEMLLIIAEGKLKDYEKVKSKVSPKEYAKANIKLGKQAYDNSTQFYEDYFGDNVEVLVDAIKQYQKLRGKAHGKDELCLAELLRY